MTAADWADPNARSLALYLDGSTILTAPLTAAPRRRRLPRSRQWLVATAPVRHSIHPTRPELDGEIDTFDPAKAPTPTPPLPRAR